MALWWTRHGLWWLVSYVLVFAVSATLVVQQILNANPTSTQKNNWMFSVIITIYQAPKYAWLAVVWAVDSQWSLLFRPGPVSSSLLRGRYLFTLLQCTPLLTAHVVVMVSMSLAVQIAYRYSTIHGMNGAWSWAQSIVTGCLMYVGLTCWIAALTVTSRSGKYFALALLLAMSLGEVGANILFQLNPHVKGKGYSMYQGPEGIRLYFLGWVLGVLLIAVCLYLLRSNRRLAIVPILLTLVLALANPILGWLDRKLGGIYELWEYVTGSPTYALITGPLNSWGIQSRMGDWLHIKMWSAEGRVASAILYIATSILATSLSFLITYGLVTWIQRKSSDQSELPAFDSG